MNIDIVKKVDFFIGIPLCFFLTILRRFLKLFFWRKNKDNLFKKFLLIELSEMGSSILAYPLMKNIKKKYPEAELFFMIFKKNRASVDVLGIVPEENVLLIRDNSLFYFFADVIKIFFKLRKNKIDVVFDLELFARATAILTYLTGAPKRIGFYKYEMEGLYRGDLLTHKVQYNFQQHISKSFLSLLKIIEEPVKIYPTMNEKIEDSDIEKPKYNSSQKDLIDIKNKLLKFIPSGKNIKKIILMAPSGGEIPIRAWPIENYIALSKELLKDQNNIIILIGSHKDKKTTKKITESLKDESCIDFAGQTTFKELMDLYNASNILIANDGGTAHFASLTSIKNFIFFGPETPKIYAPLGENIRIFYSDFPCSPCLSAFNHRSTVCNDNKCLKTIPVKSVYDLIKSELNGLR